LGLRYLLNHETFKKHPIKTILRTGFWEIKKIIGLRSTIKVADFKINVYPTKRRGIDGLIYIFREIESDFKVIKKLLKPGDIIFDIGANIGYFSLYMSKKITDSGKIYAFEPVSTTFKRLQENIILNGYKNIIIEKYALFDKKERREIFLSYAHDRNSLVADNPLQKKEIVDCITLDEYIIKSNVSKISLLKIDTEGAELFVLKSGLNSIKKFKPNIYFEINNDKIKQFGYNQNDLISYLQNLNYFFYNINKGKLYKIKNNSLNCKNLFAINKLNINLYSKHIGI
jgi:FkbM family methyltransferase